MKGGAYHRNLSDNNKQKTIWSCAVKNYLSFKYQPQIQMTLDYWAYFLSTEPEHCSSIWCSSALPVSLNHGSETHSKNVFHSHGHTLFSLARRFACLLNKHFATHVFTQRTLRKGNFWFLRYLPYSAFKHMMVIQILNLTCRSILLRPHQEKVTGRLKTLGRRCNNIVT